jgi:hypothetical protein
MNPLLREVATTLQASNSERIHEDGKSVTGASIGNYSTKPRYISAAKSPKAITPKGKSPGRKVKNRKTRYYAGGYKAFRASIGRQTSSVNLSLSGKLSKEFGIIASGSNSIDIGYTTKYAKDIAKGQEKRFNKKIWGVSREDKKVVNQIVNRFVKNRLKNV